MLLMLLGVIVMGICVAFLDLTDFGTDPFAAMNLGLARRFPAISFGTWELITNGMMLIIVLIFDKNCLGFGTVGNMMLVGYTKDFVSFLLSRVFGIEAIESMAVRIVVMLIVVVVFVFAVAIYMNAGLGGSAYDALPVVIHGLMEKATHRELHFKYVRIGFDLFFTLVAFLVKGEVGIITVIMVFTLGPIIEFVSKKVSVILDINE